jgi:hypothetical protein
MLFAFYHKASETVSVGLAMLGEIELRLQASGKAIVDKEESKQTSGLVSSPFTRSDGSLISPNVEGALIDVDPSRGKGFGRVTNLHERCDDHLATFLIVQQLFGEEEVLEASARLRKKVKSAIGSGAPCGASLYDRCKGRGYRPLSRC